MKIDKIIGKLLFFLGFLFLIDPKSRIFKLNEVTFGIILIITIIRFCFHSKKINKKILIVLYFYSIFPLIYGILLSKLTYFEINSYFEKQAIVKSLFGLIILPLSLFDKESLKIYLLKLLKIYTKILFIIFVISLFILNYSDIVAKQMYWVFRNYGVLLLHSQEIFGIKIPNIFTGNLLYLLILLSSLMYNKNIRLIKNFKYILFIFILLILNGTAAIAISGVLIILYYIYTVLFKKLDSRAQLYIGILGGIVLLILFFNKLFYSGDTGNTTKFGHMISYIKLWRENIYLYLFGTGIGTGFFSEGINRITYITELSYFDIIRIYGVLVGGTILLILVYPIKSLSKNKKENWLMISYLAILFCGNTNPYLVGVTGTFFISYVYSYIK